MELGRFDSVLPAARWAVRAGMVDAFLCAPAAISTPDRTFFKATPLGQNGNAGTVELITDHG